ncbi:hypothetical protein D6D06_07530 [Aureobasidium pullulans]|nr:hypothetical protein D6D06_07530 [Aureobasidium pullulans]THX82159.1 hypothetical protein D6D05_03949 [Aureobasidium pullulans]
MAEEKTRDKASEAGAHEKLRTYQRDYQKEYRDRNREKIRAAQRLYSEQNKDKIKRWYQEHKEEARAYRDQNKDKMKAYTARYHQQHKQRVAELVRYIKLWWRKLDENRNPTAEFSCHSCFTSDWSRALPIGHENMFVNKRPRPRSPKKASDDNTEDKTETGPGDRPDPPT